eukprot:TRINITY_DN842_c0_g1_i1.p3 TRINITY_DN842_c0_g1~~TRINITY_DN842_c0_g1_i1.p3  ORF type:complete len:184 (-),score=42.11 TRINITY_DN842_c0_g1_i1:1098-1649(-)
MEPNNMSWDDSLLIQAFNNAEKAYSNNSQLIEANTNPNLNSPKKRSNSPKKRSNSPKKRRKNRNKTNTKDSTPTKPQPYQIPAEPHEYPFPEWEDVPQDDTMDTDPEPSPDASEYNQRYDQNDDQTYYQNYQNYEHNIPLPDVDQAVLNQDEALSNLLLSWYYSGYYAGQYQAIKAMNERSRQ